MKNDGSTIEAATRAPDKCGPSGILNINKPSGLTSHDVVARVRRLTGQRKAGHCGTLDPMASGVLLVCLGQATRVAEYLTRGRKTYLATVRLGIETDTYDAEGTVTGQSSGLTCTLENIAAALETLSRTTQQIPPPYSAVRQDGRRLYQMARRGIVVQPAARPIAIHALDLVRWQPPDLAIEISCSAGTYVRSLAHDLGQMLGTGGHLTSLMRQRSGDWSIEEATTLEDLGAAVESGRWEGLLHPLDEALHLFPRLDVPDDLIERLTLGQPIELAGGPESPTACVYAADGSLRALVQPSARAPGWWRPRKVFLPC